MTRPVKSEARPRPRADVHRPLPTPSDGRTYPARGIHAKVINEIGRAIVGGGIKPDESLPREPDLIAQFGVSRTAIREAVKVLAAKGLVEARQKTGTKVRPRDCWNLLDPDILAWMSGSHLDPTFVRDLIELRQVVEPAAVRQAATRATPEHLAQVEGAFAQMRAASVAGDVEAYYVADLNFHSAIFTASGNQLIDRLGAIVRTMLEASFRIQWRSLIAPDRGLAIHQAVFERIRDRDPDGAVAAMLTIIDLARRELDAAAVADPSNPR